MNTTVIITEKKSVSQALLRALAPDSYDDRGNSSVQHSDIIARRTRSEKDSIRSLEDINCEVLSQRLKSSNYFYFCQPDCISCDFRAEHIDVGGKKSASRARNRIRYVNETITKDLRFPVIEAIRKLNERATARAIAEFVFGMNHPAAERLDAATESLEDSIERTLIRLSLEGSVVQAGGAYRVNPDFRGKMRYELIISEDINYYVFNRNSQLVIIADTNGNPLNMRRRERALFMERLMQECPDWESLQQYIEFKPRLETRDRDSKSSEARIKLFNALLSKRRLPCDFDGGRAGDPINLEKVIAATDFDVAGSYIILSLIENANAVSVRATRDGSAPRLITPDMLYRMKLSSMEPESVVKEFENPSEFDWENALAGKARSYFDFVFGDAVNSTIRHVKDRYLKLREAEYVDFSTGRTLFLALKKIIEEEKKIASELEKDYLYIVFEGLCDLENMKKSLEVGYFSALHIREQSRHISYSRFIELCQQDEVGTNTTRYNLIGRLEKRDLIVTGDNKIVSTPFGRFYYEAFSPVLEPTSGFNINVWNDNLRQMIDSWSASLAPGAPSRSKEQIEKEFSDFMNWFFYEIKTSAPYMREKYPALVRNLWDAYRSLPTMSYAPRKEIEESREESKEEGIVLIGNNALLSHSQVKSIIESDPTSSSYNKPRKGAPTTITRMIPQTPVSLEEAVRRVCCIGRGVEFKVVSSFKLPKVATLENENYTVFRAEITPGSDNVVKLYLESGRGIESLQELVIEGVPQQQTDRGSLAHEPLYLTDIRPADIAGKDGMLLVQEYQKPWVATADKISKKQQGLVNVASFKSSSHEFGRIERYEFRKVHNFETLLIAMMEKYNMPFAKTARLAEELYLSV